MPYIGSICVIFWTLAVRCGPSSRRFAIELNNSKTALNYQLALAEALKSQYAQGLLRLGAEVRRDHFVRTARGLGDELDVIIAFYKSIL